MKKPVLFGMAVITLVVLAALVVLPVSGAVTISANGTSPAPDATITVAAKQYVTATVSSGAPVVGEPVTISGMVTGSMLSAGVKIWVFAGNFVNVSTVPVDAKGTFSKTYPSTGMPPATYYVYIQSPGANGKYNIDLQESGIYSGQVVNSQTNALIFNFTGTGSVKDAAAAQALSDAINTQGVDDAYTKLTFQLAAPVATPQAVQTTAVVPVATTTTKSPLPLEITGFALVIGGLGAAMLSGKLP
jgi:hypothetical protein